MEEADTAVEVEDSTGAVAADFMAAVAGFTAVEVLVEEAEAARSAAGTRMAVDIVAGMAAMVAADFMVVAAATDGAVGVTVGAAEVGAAVGADEAGVGAGDLAMAGRIGDMAGDIRIMATTATHITRPTLTIILTRLTVTRRTT